LAFCVLAIPFGCRAQPQLSPVSPVKPGKWLVAAVTCPGCTATASDPAIGTVLVIGPDRLVDPLNLDCPAGLSFGPSKPISSGALIQH